MKHIGVKTIFKAETDILSPKAYHRYAFKLTQKYASWEKPLMLDIGCLVGNFILLLGNSNAVGVDVLSEPVRLFAKKHCPKNEFMLSSALVLPFRDSTFETLTMWEVIEHVPIGTEEKTFQEVNRVLKENGTLLLSTPNRHILSILLDPAYFLFKHRHYRKKDLERMLNKNGFSIVHSETKAGFSTHVGFLLTAFFKYAFRKRIEKLQRYLDKKSESDYARNGGFATIFLVARKTS